MAIATPCDVHWDTMAGTTRKRRCEACARDVYDLSAHSLEEANALLGNGDRPCIGFRRRHDGTVVANDCGRARPVDWLRKWGATTAVVVTLVSLATAVVSWCRPQLQRARMTQSRSDALELRSAVVRYLGLVRNARCATTEDLVRTGVVDPSIRTTDAWDLPFRVECNGEDIVVSSAGPDRVFGSDDDLR